MSHSSPLSFAGNNASEKSSSQSTSFSVGEHADSDDSDGIDEDSILRDNNSHGIYVAKVLKTSENIRVYNSYQYCFLCKKMVSKFAQHVKKVHEKTNEVTLVINAETPKEKTRQLSLLRAKSNHIKNLKSIHDGRGEIVLYRRPLQTFDVRKYGPCPNCFLWVAKRLLWKHQQCCCARCGSRQTTASLVTQSDALALRIIPTASKKLRREVFEKLHNDEVGLVARGDRLIVMLGNQWLEKNIGNALKRGKYTSQVIRLAARLLVSLRTVYPLPEAKNTMDDYLKPSYFDAIIEATLLTAAPNMDDVDDLAKPSNAIKLGFDVKRMINAKLGLAIQNDAPEARKEAEDLLKLMELFWGTRVTKLARVLLEQRHYYRSKDLPDPDDIKRLNEYLKEEMDKLSYTDATYHNYCHIACLVLAKLVSYNRRRTGELEGAR